MIEFKSGLKLVFVQNTAVRSVAIGVFVGAGVVKETPENAGISHFIEHMVFKGTTKRSAFDIVNEIDCIGAQINAYTAKSYTCFHTVSLDTNAEKCADVLSDMYFNPAFDPVELEKERRVVIEEINESEDTPDDLCLERLLSLFFKGCPLEKAILGTKKTLKEMTSQTLKDYHDKHYVAKTPCCLLPAISPRNKQSPSHRSISRTNMPRTCLTKTYPLPRALRIRMHASVKGYRTNAHRICVSVLSVQRYKR